MLRAMRYLVSATLIVAGIIHLLPLSGVVGAERLAALYGVPLGDPNLVLLMRHRAVLFGLLGLFLVYAAFKPSLQALAFVAGFVSVVSFIWLARPVSALNTAVGRVFVADLVALGCLVAGAVALLYARRRQA
jgi:hypothetical protein